MYQRLPAGPSYSTILPTMDFETYSEAGYYWDDQAGRWYGITKSDPGLGAVGAPVYSEHPSTVVLSLAYDLKDGAGPQLWTSDCPLPIRLFTHIQSGGLLEAWNSAFEYHIWLNVCHKRMGWPALPFTQLRDAMAKSRAHSLPGKLEKAAGVLGAVEQKSATGKALIRKLSVPQQATKKRPAGRNSDPALLAELYDYNLQDVRAESAVSELCPDLSQFETRVWLLDQDINFRGVYIDQKALADCISIFRQAEAKYTAELQRITCGTVQSAGELAKLQGWLGANGCHTGNLDADAVDAALERTDLTPSCRRILEIRSILGAASVKKLFAIERRVSADGRLRDLFAYCGADRTGRFCIAGGQLVLVKAKDGRVLEVPIEDITLEHQLWDGREWVAHGGVVPAGVKEVITHDGVTATPDHRVFTSTSEYATLQKVKLSGQLIYRGELVCPTISTNLHHQAENTTSELLKT